MKRLLISALATVGALVVLLVAGVVVFVWVFDGGSDYEVKSSVASPDGGHTATLYQGMGGGAAGWCSQVIAVNTPNAPFSLEHEKDSGDFQVFRANCSADIQVRWLSNSLLHIEFFESEPGDGLSVYMQQSDDSGQVKLEYSFGA
jgi:hypothetical protein